ncbi:flavin monoamine oxidase family protein [Estrella lausannensis]|uniref:Tryptophan 2-monooxygenase n=1 Tax=Estrella lausannensis TaxID=483423 RepID=A0A0H5DRH0_9BACT|nr:NAD(P)/FAD-dependent oxidoreductase [Estrella lausannensis]CRX38284.1 Amine oxidoreductase [Estrella lausannensis]
MGSRGIKVAVVGGGLSGLTTAYRLAEQGFDVELFEARNRVGGRVLTAFINDVPVDLGGQNVSDGGKAAHIHTLADELDLKFNATDAVINNYYFDGKKIVEVQRLLSEKQFTSQALEVRMRDLMKEAHTLEDILRGILDQEDPLYKSISVRMAAYEGAPVHALSPYYAETLMHMLLGGISAAHPGKGEGQTKIHLLRIEGGAFSLPEKLANKLGPRVHLNKPLTALEKSEGGSILLSFADGTSFKADLVALTMPCSVYEDISFGDETIPEDTLDAIRSIRYGGNSKIVVPCSEVPNLPDVLINDRALCFFDLSHPLLTLYYTGEASSYTGETIGATYRQDRAMLKTWGALACPPYLEPVIADDTPFVRYSTPVGFSWPLDRYAKGSYSFISPGQEELFTDLKSHQGEVVKTLFAPIGQKIFFAGEHASILLDVPGTMESACESGERTARMIARAILQNQ